MVTAEILVKIVVPIVTAVLGFAGGVATTLLGPWANWRVEKTRLQHQRRVERIKEWRDGVDSLRHAEDEDTQTPLGRVVVVPPTELTYVTSLTQVASVGSPP